MVTKKVKEEKSIEVQLWDTAVRLRGTVDPAYYKNVVLGLIFLKFISDNYVEQRKKLIEMGQEAFIDMPAFYAQDNTFYLPEESRWSYIIDNAKQNDIAIKIDKALSDIESNNKSLIGALPDNNFYSNLGIERSKLASLLDAINKIDTQKNPEVDLIGRVYEYFLQKFAIDGGKKGEFYTPKSIVNLMATMIEPYSGIVYDPCCGSGGMFVQSMKFIESHHGDKQNVSIYGQEQNRETFKLAKMNLALRGIGGNLGEEAADTFAKDLHKDLKADYIMANPPFNLKLWREDKELLKDERWQGYDVPPVSNGNYAWILNIVSKLSCNGIAAFLLANGALNAGGEEYKIRKRLVENGLIEAIIVLPRNMFYSTDISVTLWIINKNKAAKISSRNHVEVQNQDPQDEVLFMDLRTLGVEYEKKYIELTDEEIEKATEIYHNWKKGINYEDIPELCYSANTDEIRTHDFALAPSKYIEFIDRDSGLNYHNEMGRIQKEFTDLMRAEKKSQQAIVDAFKGLGYEVKL
ncbi:N-6 DNA methylase [Sporosarcina sp. ANT_H38]|uniref:type I restriction-modification system subunit M n=1 Tax=Sporosarcina sp. ANT_H38 TaxID=2597358 RepID=UPI0011F0ABFD|nr:class I SAM-dependent DNA methyltransferase [Sporosarcina sp. ANT_H38]KAA0941649.1 N-6 DNA methylase [Sporosarcina sp. ANT_H38]